MIHTSLSAQMRMITESFNTLEINTNLVMQYFFWHGMNEPMQQQFIHITNNSKPDFAQIQNHMFEAAERYLALKKTKSSKETTWVSAATVNTEGKKLNPKPRYCNWCTGKGTTVGTHSSFDCKKYPTSEEKISRLNALHGCSKCGNFQHVTDDCKFKFKQNCAHCNESHFRYLCPTMKKNEFKGKSFNKNFSKKENKKTEKDSADVQTGSVFIGKVNIQHYGEDAVIPTFTINYAPGQVLRGMRDSGCQPNLITQKCAEKLKLKNISDEFPLSINGFNSSIKRGVKIVELKINSNEPPIKTICMCAIYQCKIEIAWTDGDSP